MLPLLYYFYMAITYDVAACTHGNRSVAGSGPVRCAEPLRQHRLLTRDVYLFQVKQTFA
jgi:hypothetical protein